MKTKLSIYDGAVSFRVFIASASDDAFSPASTNWASIEIYERGAEVADLNVFAPHINIAREYVLALRDACNRALEADLKTRGPEAVNLAVPPPPRPPLGDDEVPF